MNSVNNLFSSSFHFHKLDSIPFHEWRYPTMSTGKKPSSLKNADKTFDKSPKRVCISTKTLNSIGVMQTDHHELEKKNRTDSTETLFDSIGQHFGQHSEGNVMINVLSFCAREGSIELGKKIHASIVKTGRIEDRFVITSLIDMYAKCGDINTAVTIFKQMECVDVASCNSLISGLARNGLFIQAFDFFSDIGSMDIEPSSYTYTTMLTICGNLSDGKNGKKLHGHVVKMMFLSEVAVGNALLTMYTKCGMMEDAETLFKVLPKRNMISWTIVVNGFYQNCEFTKSLEYFRLMRENDVEPNEYAFTICLASCGCIKNVDYGRVFHAMVVKIGFGSSDFVRTAIVDMYVGVGKFDDARKTMIEMRRFASSATWNALLAGLVREEKAEVARECFRDMVNNNDVSSCDEFTYSIMLKASTSLTSLETCRQIHSRVTKTEYVTNSHVASSLIEAYNKCGSLKHAERVFHRISEPDTVSWNSMIKAYSQNGYPIKAISLFRNMIEKGVKPSNPTFLAVIAACSHSGLVREGQELFNSMVTDYDVIPDETHYSAMVDLFGRAGNLDTAVDFINNLSVKLTAPIWRPLLAACRCHRNLKMAEYVGKRILKLDPDDPTVYVTLSNMYHEAGRVHEAENQRRLMVTKNVTKEPGCSWIEVNNRIHKFYSRDKTHIDTAKVYDKLKEIARRIKNMGYSKDDTSLYHSEKLALCFGLVMLSSGVPIRVFKNLRVCADCHSFMKYASMITEREIVLRDNFRFHRFKQGDCSCKDFW